jgi:hypothetical protein
MDLFVEHAIGVMKHVFSTSIVAAICVLACGLLAIAFPFGLTIPSFSMAVASAIFGVPAKPSSQAELSPSSPPEKKPNTKISIFAT